MPEVLVVVSGLTGSGKSSVASEIEIALRAIGVRTTWDDGGSERNGVRADLLDPGVRADLTVTIREVNIAHISPGSFGGSTLANSCAPPAETRKPDPYDRQLRIEQLEHHLRAVLEVCASEGLHGFGALDDAADILK